MDFVQWSAPKNDEEIDRRVVVNPAQARLLLTAVAKKDPRLEAFFGCMYFAALRPAEMLHLRLDDCDLPESGWGSLHLTGSTQRAGQEWSDSGEVMEDRALKHRATSATRIVPAAPELVRLLRQHIDEYGAAADGRLFVRRYYQHGPVSKETYSRVWRQARAMVLTESQQRSPLAKVPYHLRHAAVSLWLNAGVPATQVAEWAGHSVNVLLKVYAKCIDGQDEAARSRIEAALRSKGWDEPRIRGQLSDGPAYTEKPDHDG
jgi:integrase